MNVTGPVSPQYLRQPKVQFGNLPADAARAAKNAVETRGQHLGIEGLSQNFLKTAGLVVVGLAAVGAAERLATTLLKPVEKAVVNKHTTKAAKSVKGKISNEFHTSLEKIDDAWFSLKRKFTTSPGKQAAQRAARQEKAAAIKAARAAKRAALQAEKEAKAAALKEAKATKLQKEAAQKAAKKAKAAAKQ